MKYGRHRQQQSMQIKRSREAEGIQSSINRNDSFYFFYRQIFFFSCAFGLFPKNLAGFLLIK